MFSKQGLKLRKDLIQDKIHWELTHNWNLYYVGAECAQACKKLGNVSLQLHSAK